MTSGLTSTGPMWPGTEGTVEKRRTEPASQATGSTEADGSIDELMRVTSTSDLLSTRGGGRGAGAIGTGTAAAALAASIMTESGTLTRSRRRQRHRPKRRTDNTAPGPAP